MVTAGLQPDRRSNDPNLEERHLARIPKPLPRGKFRSLGLGIITGASDDDPTAVGTYASAGAAFGTFILWVVPLAYPMMVVVVTCARNLGRSWSSQEQMVSGFSRNRRLGNYDL